MIAEPLKILVLGATGGTGQHIVAQALALSHDVTALARDPSRLRVGGGSLRIVKGSIGETAGVLDGAVAGQDAVISALGRGNALKSNGLIAGSIPTIIAAMEKHGVRRLVFMSAFGVGETRRGAPLLPRIFYAVFLGDLFADKEAGETILRRSSLDWTLVHPTMLTDGPRTSAYRAGERLELSGMPRISRADVADFVLKQLNDPTYVRKSVSVSG